MSAAPMSVAAYAKHRGVTPRAIRKAIQDGRLADAVVVVETKSGKRQPKIADAEAADRELDANTRTSASRTGPPGEGPEEYPEEYPEALPYAEARRRREIELWRQARLKTEADELELRARRGELVSAEEARATVIDRFTTVKTKLLGIPTRCKQRVKKLTADDVRLIDDLLREALEDLADGR